MTARKTRKTDLPKRDRQLNIRLTAAEYAAVERSARKISLDPSTFARMQTMKGTDYDPDEESS